MHDLDDYRLKFNYKEGLRSGEKKCLEESVGKGRKGMGAAVNVNEEHTKIMADLVVTTMGQGPHGDNKITIFSFFSICFFCLGGE
jgi:hypothetical protein